MSNSKKIDAVDFIRALAISCIVAYHIVTIYMHSLPAIVQKLGLVLATGTDAFFVMSGFGLYCSHKRKPLSAPKFWAKRLTKIYIPYIIVVIISYYYQDIYLAYDVPRKTALMSHIFLFKMFMPEYETSFGGLFWFISTIFQFYFVFPLLVKLYKRLGTKKYLLLTFGINLAWAVFTVITGLETERIWNSFFLQFLFQFSLGMAAADHLEEVTQWIRKCSARKLFLLSIAGYAVLLAVYFAGGIFGAMTDLPSAVGFTFFALSLYKLGIEGFNRFMVSLSSMSYEWYLVHNIVIVFCYFNKGDFIKNMTTDIIYGVYAFLATLAVAAVYHIAWSGVSATARKAARFLAEKLRSCSRRADTQS